MKTKKPSEFPDLAAAKEVRGGIGQVLRNALNSLKTPLKVIGAAPHADPGKNPGVGQQSDRKYPTSLCFSAATMVMGWDGTRAIEAIKAGELVLTFDIAAGEWCWTEVMAVDVHPGAFHGYTSPDRSCFVTDNHRFFDGNSWRRFGESQILQGDNSLVTCDWSEELHCGTVFNLRTALGTYGVGAQLLLSSGGTIEDLLVH